MTGVCPAHIISSLTRWRNSMYSICIAFAKPAEGPMATRTVCLYLRCSTSSQETEIQRTDLNQYITTRGWLVFNVYEDLAYTGTNTERPAFQQMLKDAKAGKFSAIVVWRLDRFGRSIRDIVLHLQDLHDFGVDFVSLKENLDFGTASGRLMFHLIAAFSEFECATIRQRVQAGVRAKIAKTGRWGRAKSRDDDTIRKLRDKGMSIRQIARELRIAPTTVRRGLEGEPITQKKPSR